MTIHFIGSKEADFAFVQCNSCSLLGPWESSASSVTQEAVTHDRFTFGKHQIVVYRFDEKHTLHPAEGDELRRFDAGFVEIYTG